MSRETSEWMKFFGRWFYESDRVGRISVAADGLYVALLWKQWTRGGWLPEEPDRIRDLFPQKYARTFAKLWPEVEQFFPPIGDGRRSNDTNAALLQMAESRISELSAAGLKGAESRWRGHKPPDGHANATALADGTQSANASGEGEGEREEIPPKPPAAAGGVAVAPGRKRPKRTAPEPWTDVLGRAECAGIRADPAFGVAWGEWIAWCRTSGVKAKEPRGPQAAKLLNLALEWGSAAFAVSVSYSIAGDYPSLYDRRGATNVSANGRAPTNGHALTPEWKAKAKATLAIDPASLTDRRAKTHAEQDRQSVLDELRSHHLQPSDL